MRDEHHGIGLKPTADELQAINTLNFLIYGNWVTMITYAFAELGIADILENKSVSIDEISRQTGTVPDVLNRFMRCAQNLGLVRGSNKVYHIAPLGRLLSSNHPLSKRNLARLNGADYRYQPWGHLLEILHEGPSEKFSPTFAEGSLNYLSDKPEKLKVFRDAMLDAAREENLPIARAYDFSNVAHVADLGCGNSSFMTTILELNPHLEGTLFDLPAILEMETIPEELNNRLHKVPGDFFSRISVDADIYIIKNVIHNWPEDKAVSLLENIAGSMRKGKQPVQKRLLIIEHLIDESNPANRANWLDLNFLILVGGIERDEEDYRKLTARAGLELCRNIPTSTGRNILEFKLSWHP